MELVLIASMRLAKPVDTGNFLYVIVLRIQEENRYIDRLFEAKDGYQ